MRRARWSRAPSFIEELTVATLVSAVAWFPAVFAFAWVVIQMLRCTYI
jgi:hypothetical protein